MNTEARDNVYVHKEKVCEFAKSCVSPSAEKNSSLVGTIKLWPYGQTLHKTIASMAIDTTVFFFLRGGRLCGAQWYNWLREMNAVCDNNYGPAHLGT